MCYRGRKCYKKVGRHRSAFWCILPHKKDIYNPLRKRCLYFPPITIFYTFPRRNIVNNLSHSLDSLGIKNISRDKLINTTVIINVITLFNSISRLYIYYQVWEITSSRDIMIEYHSCILPLTNTWVNIFYIWYKIFITFSLPMILIH